MKAIRQILWLLSPRERRRGLLLLGMAIVMAMMETAGVASVMPFLSVLGNPDVIHQNALLAWAYEIGGFSSNRDFLFALGAGSLGVVVFAAFWRAATQWAMAHYIQMRNHSIGSRLLASYLRQPHAFFLGRNSADLSKSILSEVQIFINNVLQPGITLIAYGLVAVALVGFLLFMNPMLALIAGSVITGAYALIYLSIRQFTQRIGSERVHANRQRFSAASEALGGVKDIKILGLERVYLNRFVTPSWRFAHFIALNAVTRQLPKALMEAIGFGGIIGLTLLLMAQGDSIGEVLPMLGLYAFAGYRLLPAFQNIYASLVQVRFGLPAADALVEDMSERQRNEVSTSHVRSPMQLTSEIQIEDLNYRYPGSKRLALKNVNLHVPAHSSLGIVGRTGSGKTTLVDIMMGLLEPETGRFSVDGEVITATNRRDWQAALGYVPQQIYLVDDSVASNIALGIERAEIDMAAVERAAKLADLHNFIVEELPQGYDTFVGERGVRLSGGQRQRIGIARALYRDPEVLIFDEATSALDHATERVIMESVARLGRAKTLVIIAHRVSTVRSCDRIALLESGRIKAINDYDTLFEEDPSFRKLIAKN